jgi:hypothetical protein
MEGAITGPRLPAGGEVAPAGAVGNDREDNGVVAVDEIEAQPAARIASAAAIAAPRTMTGTLTTHPFVCIGCGEHSGV